MNQNKLKNRTKGFTLFETLIYIAIASVVIVSFVSFILSISGSRNKNYVVQEVQGNARNVLDLIQQKILLADDVISPTEGNTDISLILDMPGAEPNLEFSLDNDIISITEGAGLPVPITSNKIRTTNLTFTNLAGNNERDNIKIGITMEYLNNQSIDFTFSQDFQTAVSVRK